MTTSIWATFHDGVQDLKLLRDEIRVGATVSSLMTRNVAICTPHTSLADAARRMWQRNVGCLAVVDYGRVVGMVTDRDACMSGCLEGRSLDLIPAGNAMSKSVFACSPGTSLHEARSIMKDRRVRRLPVLDRDGHLVGIVTLGDLARGADAPHGQHDGGGVTADDVAATLAAIIGPQDSQPHEGWA
jgi:CBS domain-containing protein